MRVVTACVCLLRQLGFLVQVVVGDLILACGVIVSGGILLQRQQSPGRPLLVENYRGK